MLLYNAKPLFFSSSSFFPFFSFQFLCIGPCSISFFSVARAYTM
jgi:hypothetical protein